ncbi:MAG TPA: N-acetylmuramoyl-L-alanine amidase [Methylocella sp.]|nr:N-acetylmuramoyl-L-alanine amidase [Methylocella sp.]
MPIIAKRPLSAAAFSAVVSLGWILTSLAAAPELPAALPVVETASLGSVGEHWKLVFDLSAPVTPSAFVLADPDRVIVDLPRTDFRLDPQAGRRNYGILHHASLIESFRFGQLDPGRSRIVIDLRSPAQLVHVGCEKDNAGRLSLVIELAKTDRAAFHAQAQQVRARIAAEPQGPRSEKAAGVSDKPIIVLDPGHGGIDRGAMVKDLVEKDLVFDFAQTLAAKLEADGRLKVLMTRTDDSFVPLSERVRMARENNARLFVSIHADTLSNASQVSGATVYTVSERASDAEAERVAEHENKADSAAGLDQAEDVSDVSDILFDLTRRETHAYSHYFARTLANYWRVAGKLNKNPQRSAGFRVLKAPDIPSVLLELGYLSNREDSQALSSPQWRDKAASQVAEAIEAFFSAQENQTSVVKAGGPSFPKDTPLDNP